MRAAAIQLYGEALQSGRKFRLLLRSQAFQAVVPLLLHLADPCPQVALVSRRGVLWLRLTT